MGNRVAFTALVICCQCKRVLGTIACDWPRKDYEAAANLAHGPIKSHGLCPECCAIELASLAPAPDGGPRSDAA